LFAFLVEIILMISSALSVKNRLATTKSFSLVVAQSITHRSSK